VIGTAGGFRGDDARWETAGLVGAALAGYPGGLRYVRRASYNVTPGDLGVLSTTGVLGLMGAGTIVADANAQVVTGLLTAGFLGGLAAGDRLFVRPFDFTDGEGWLVRLGALAGGAVAVAIPLAAEVENGRVYLGLATLGAAIGMGITTKMLAPLRSQQSRAAGTGNGRGRR
jgi:hypothetical protein